MAQFNSETARLAGQNVSPPLFRQDKVGKSQALFIDLNSMGGMPPRLSCG